MTQEAILSTLAAFDGLVYAHEVFDFLLSGEFPDDRSILLLPEVAEEIQGMPRSPGEEDPHVSSQEQVMTLFRNFTLNVGMRWRYDYEPCDMSCGLWKWKTRTVRLAGIYCGGAACFVIARATFARNLKNNGKASVAKEKEFATSAAARLQKVGLLKHAWLTRNPHDGEITSFDPD